MHETHPGVQDMVSGTFFRNSLTLAQFRLTLIYHRLVILS